MLSSNSVVVESDIQKFYKNLNVFVTGATGFLGFATVEKLLRCTQVSKVYLLIRKKNGKTVEERLEGYLSNEVFSNLKKVCPEFQKRVVAVDGDCLLPQLGISETDRVTLMSNVDVVLHIAANVMWEDPLKFAFQMNTLGTKEVVDICRDMKNLKAMVHVSTAYCRLHTNYLHERIHPMPYELDEFKKILNGLSDVEVKKQTKTLLQGWPFTYAFTKSFGEVVVEKYGKGFPKSIYRPCSVIAAYKEPLPGWINNNYWPTVVLAGMMAGNMKAFYMRDEIEFDMVPVDYCANAVLAVGWKTATDKKINEIPVYNHVAAETPIPFGNVLKKVAEKSKTMGSCFTPNPSCKLTTNYKKYAIMKYRYHILPAAAMDVMQLFRGKRPNLLKKMLKREEFVNSFVKCEPRNWKFQQNGLINLWTSMNKTDAQLFHFSMKNFNWDRYLNTFTEGVRKYMFKK